MENAAENARHAPKIYIPLDLSDVKKSVKIRHEPWYFYTMIVNFFANFVAIFSAS
jgi:hypothetical protein